MRDIREQAFFADVVVRTGADGTSVRRTRIRPVTPQPQGSLDPVREGKTVTRFEVARYLESAQGWR